MFQTFNISNSPNDLPIGCCIIQRQPDNRFELLGVLTHYSYATSISDAMNDDGKSTFVVFLDQTRVFRKIYRKGLWYETLIEAAKD